MQVTYIMKPEDLNLFDTRSQITARARFIPAVLIMTVVILILSFVFMRFMPVPPHHVVRRVSHEDSALPSILGLFLPMIVFAIFFVIVLRSAKSDRAKLFETEPALKEPQTTEITPQYLRHQDATGEVKTRWQGINKVVETATHIFLWISPSQAHVVPKRAFASEEDATTFAQNATNYWKSAH